MRGTPRAHVGPWVSLGGDMIASKLHPMSGVDSLTPAEVAR
jgi:hypothetical protein